AHNHLSSTGSSIINESLATRLLRSCDLDVGIGSSPAGPDVANGLGSLGERVLAIDYRAQLSGYGKLFQNEKVLMRHVGQERHEPGVPETLPNERHDRAPHDREHAGLRRAGNHEPSAWRHNPAPR